MKNQIFYKVGKFDRPFSMEIGSIFKFCTTMRGDTYEVIVYTYS